MNATLRSVFNLFSSAVTAGGTVMIVWGAIQLGAAIKDKNGPDMQKAIWTMIGGAIIFAAGEFLKNTNLTISTSSLFESILALM